MYFYLGCAEVKYLSISSLVRELWSNVNSDKLCLAFLNNLLSTHWFCLFIYLLPLFCNKYFPAEKGHLGQLIHPFVSPVNNLSLYFLNTGFLLISLSEGLNYHFIGFPVCPPFVIHLAYSAAFLSGNKQMHSHVIQY